MFWKVPTHNLICGDSKGNIALQVSGLTPDRRRLERTDCRCRAPGSTSGRASAATCRASSTRSAGTSRRRTTTRILQATRAGRCCTTTSRRRGSLAHRAHPADAQHGTEVLASRPRAHAARRVLAARGARPAALQGLEEHRTPTSRSARAMIEGWDRVLSKDTTPGAIYVRWTATDAARGADTGKAAGAERQALVETGLRQALDRSSKDWGVELERVALRPHQQERCCRTMFVPEFSLPAVERPGGFNTVNATGANFRRIIDLVERRQLGGDQRAGAVGAAGKSVLRQQPRLSGRRQVLPVAVQPRGRGQAVGAHADDQALIARKPFLTAPGQGR